MNNTIKESVATLRQLAVSLRGDKRKTEASIVQAVSLNLKKLIEKPKDIHITKNELIRQQYGGNKCTFSGGTCDGAGVDTVYIRLEKDGVRPTELLLRPDEMAAIAWLCNGVLWSLTVSDTVRGTIPQNIAD